MYQGASGTPCKESLLETLYVQDYLRNLAFIYCLIDLLHNWNLVTDFNDIFRKY